MIEWGVVVTRAAGEKLAAEHLRRAGFPVLCPLVRLPNGHTVTLFWRYVFIQFDFADPHDWHRVRYSPAVTRILGDEDPKFLPHRFVRSILEWGDEVIEARSEEQRGVTWRGVLDTLFRGEEVIITQGPLANERGRVIWSSLAAVNLEVLGREVSVPRSHVELVALNDGPVDRREDYLRRRIARHLARPSDDVQPDRRLGCTMRGLVSFMEAQFQSGMTWNNWGQVWRLGYRRRYPAQQDDRNYHYSNLIPMSVSEFDLQWAAQQRVGALSSSQRSSQHLLRA